MRGLYHQMLPFTPDSCGAAAVFADTSATVVPIDKNGTASTYWSRLGAGAGSCMQVVSPFDIGEMSFVLSDDEDYLSSLVQAVAYQSSDFVVLLHGPVSSMTGVDLSRLAEELEERIARPVLAVDCSGSRPYDEGLSQAMLAVFERVEADGAAAHEVEPDSINVLGLNAVDHNDVNERWMFAETLLGQVASSVLSYWGCFGGWSEWSLAPAAERNVVMSVSAARLAKKMERCWGIPALYFDELDLELFDSQTAEALQHVALGRRILVVGEQLSANVVRKALVGADVRKGGRGVTVASFFRMLPDHRCEQDLQFASERDCAKVLGSGGFDFVVGDAALRRFVPEDVGFFELPHSAIADPMGFIDSGAVTPLSQDWFWGLARALEGGVTR